MSNYIRSEFVEEPIVAIRAGKKGQPQSLTAGGQYAYGTITFADEPTAADTITLNSSVVEFSASATDFTTAGTVADPYILQLTGTLSDTIDALVTQLNGSSDTNLTPATYAKSGTTILTITYDTLGTAGNAYTLAASSDTASGTTLSGGAAAVALSNNTDSVDIALTSARDSYFTLADGVEFQTKTIVCSAKSTGDAIITVASLDGSSDVAVTLGTAGQYLVYQFLDSEWKSLVDVSTAAINALTPTDSNFIVGNGTTWVTESGSTVRTSLGFTSPILDKAAPGAIGGTTPAAVTGTTVTANTSLVVGTGGTFVADNGTAAATTGAATSNTMAGIITSEALTTAAASTYTLTLTNSLITANSNILVTCGFGTATAGVPVVQSVVPGAGSASIVVINNDPAAALNGTILIQYMIVAP